MISRTSGAGSASWSCTASQYSSVSDEPSCHVRRTTSARSAGYEWALLLVYRTAVPPTARGGSEHRGRAHEDRGGILQASPMTLSSSAATSPPCTKPREFLCAERISTPKTTQAPCALQ